MDRPTTPTFLSDPEAPLPTKPVVYSPVPTYILNVSVSFLFFYLMVKTRVKIALTYHQDIKGLHCGRSIFVSYVSMSPIGFRRFGLRGRYIRQQATPFSSPDLWGSM